MSGYLKTICFRVSPAAAVDPIRALLFFLLFSLLLRAVVDVVVDDDPAVEVVLVIGGTAVKASVNQWIRC